MQDMYSMTLFSTTKPQSSKNCCHLKQIPPYNGEYMIISDISCQLFDNKQAGVFCLTAPELLSKLTYGQKVGEH